MYTKDDKTWFQKNFATKDDLRSIKDDIKTTKTDLSKIADLLEPLKGDLEETKREIKTVNAHNFRVELKLTDMEQKFEKNLFIWKSELFDKIDKILGRTKIAEEENTILSAREETRREEREKLDTRLKKLESIHPQNRHTAP